MSGDWIYNKGSGPLMSRARMVDRTGALDSRLRIHWQGQLRLDFVRSSERVGDNAICRANGAGFQQIIFPAAE
jgi:hypothetical protein